MFHALADPGRRSMVERLSHGPASVSELARPLDMSLTAADRPHTLDFRVGGADTRAPAPRVAAPHVRRRLHDIVESRRIVYRYRMTLGGRPISVSLTTCATHVLITKR